MSFVMNSILKLLTYILLLSKSLAFTQKHPCRDVQKFNHSNETCASIEKDENLRQNLCQNEEVKENCPRTCGQCCENDPNYTFKTKYGVPKEKNCKWLRYDYRRVVHCDTWKNDIKVHDACPKACNTCKDPVLGTDMVWNLTTSAPSMLKPTVSPAPSVRCVEDHEFQFIYNFTNHTCITLGAKESLRQNMCTNTKVRNACPNNCGLCCSDDSTYTFIGKEGEEVSCDWISQNQVRMLRFCDRFKNGRAIREACAFTCDTCKSIVHASEISDRNDTDSNALTSDEEEDNIETPWGIITFIIIASLLGFLSIAKMIKQMIKCCRQAKKVDNQGLHETKDQGDGPLMEVQESTSTLQLSAEKMEKQKQQRLTALKILNELEKSENESKDKKIYDNPLISRDTSYIQPNFAALNALHSTIDVHHCVNFPCEICQNKQSTTFIKAPTTNIHRDSNGNVYFTGVPLSEIGPNLTNQVPMEESITCLDEDDDEEDGDGMTETTFSRSDYLNPINKENKVSFDNDEEFCLKNTRKMMTSNSNDSSIYQPVSLSDSDSEEDSVKAGAAEI